MSDFTRLIRRLEEKQRDVRERVVIYVAFGDSVTQGCMAYNTIEYQQVFHAQVKQLLEHQFPGTTLSVINAGVSGDTASQAVERIERDVLSFRPDFVTISFGVNDAHGGLEGLPKYIASMRRLMRTIREQTDADLLALTPNMMMLRANEHIDERDTPHVASFLETAQAGYLAYYVEALRVLLAEEKVPYVDVYAKWERMQADQLDIHERLSNGINHPDRASHLEVAASIVERVLSVE